MSKLPIVRIFFADLLYSVESQWLAGDQKLKSYEAYEKQAAEYRSAWAKYEREILTNLQAVLGVRFHKPVLDVACAPFFVPKSEPLIMNFMNEPDEFVDVLMHELCHVLLTDNNKVRIRDEDNTVNLIHEWQKIFGDNFQFNTLVHIPVHALSKYVYLDVMGEPKRLDRDKHMEEGWLNADDYKASWKYVEDNNYADIIDKLREMYEEVAV